jgi:hypothetical protein
MCLTESPLDSFLEEQRLLGEYEDQALKEILVG